MAPPASPVKASLTIGSDKIDFQFNPTEYKVSKGANFNNTPNKATDGANAEFTGATPRKLSMRVVFAALNAQGDTDKDGADKIGENLEKLFKACTPTDGSKSSGSPDAPEAKFQWGKILFKGSITTVDADYQSFFADGRCSKVEVFFEMQQKTEEPMYQNPTSGGLSTMRTRTVVDGDTLASIAFAEYRNASLWRALAAANEIDDPMRVRAGTTLLVPPRLDAAAVR